MVEMGKESVLRSNFDMLQPFEPLKKEVPRKMANNKSDYQTASCILD